MSVSMVSGMEVVRPDTEPLGSSILDHATFVDNPKFGLTNNGGLWPSYNCLDIAVETPMCPNPLLSEEGEAKEFGFATWQPAFEFAVYSGVQCENVGLDRDDQRAEVERVYRRNEGRMIEAGILANRFVAFAGGEAPHESEGWAAPTDVTPAGGVSLLNALALLEGRAANMYAGKATIHMPRAAGTVLAGSGLIVWNGDKAFTKNGSKVAFGGGYDDPDMLDTGSWNMYATGEVYIERAGEIEVHQQLTLAGYIQSTLGQAPDNTITDNTTLALVEQMYRVAIDCMVLKATGKAWS